VSGIVHAVPFVQPVNCFNRFELQPGSYSEFLPDRVDVLLGFVVHPDGIGPVALESFSAPFSGGIDAHLGTEAHDWGSMVQDIHRSVHEDDIPLGIDMVTDDPSDLGKVL